MGGAFSNGLFYLAHVLSPSVPFICFRPWLRNLRIMGKQRIKKALSQYLKSTNCCVNSSLSALTPTFWLLSEAIRFFSRILFRELSLLVAMYPYMLFFPCRSIKICPLIIRKYFFTLKKEGKISNYSTLILCQTLF